MEKAQTTIARNKSRAAVAALAAGMSVASMSMVTPAEAQAISEAQSAASLSVVMEFLSNTAPDKVEAAAERLVAPNATYVSLNFDNPELAKILPWAGTNKGPKAYSGVFKVRDGKMTYFQFMEDTYASSSSFRQSGSWTVKTTGDTAPFIVGG